jgi:Fe-S oxidoreductase
MVGEETNALFKQVKNIFDPKGIFNAGKITNTPAMDSHLRVQEKNRKELSNSIFDFSEDGGILRLAEKCSGSGDCRKSEISGGLMCPSYMATRKEKDTTRARANLLRQFLSNESDLHPYDHDEIKEAMDLCLSCKGCKIECPSSIDITKMKAEFLQHYYDANGTPMRAKMIGGFSEQMKLASRFSWAYNLVFDTPWMRRIANKLVGFHPERTMPLLADTTLKKWHATRGKNNSNKINASETAARAKQVYFFCDEFTNYLDVAIGQKTILLLETLGYEVIIPDHLESGRTYLSKGLVRKAKTIINQNIEMLGGLIDESHPLIGIEPSAILTLRDEYIDLAMPANKSTAKKIAAAVFTIEEFIAAEIAKGTIHAGLFHTEAKQIALHGHCYQKVLSSQESIKNMLSIPTNYSVTVIPSGCCGMAGSFGYEQEHYAISQQVGELVLFPAVRKLSPDHIIAAAGTSCRHQIKDGTQVHAMHPVEILYDALIK